ncbi:MAG: hypothetical protein CMC15_18605 [Flavobacteriaceae bacterium]|nr:hypothetical protein [Flavobacteriaceae bacterium]
MKLQKPMVNPEFDENKPYELTVLSFHKNRVEAYNEFSKVLRDKGFPYLNKTIKFNRYNPVQCDQTGQIWITATECAKERMLDVGQLGRHLRREVGFLSVKGNTYSFVIDNPGPPKKTEKKEPKKYEPGRLM